MAFLQNRHRRGAIWAFAPMLLWIGVILFLSSQAGAMSETSRFVRPLLRWLFPLSPESTLDIYHGLIRKSAHLFEYGVLALLALRALSTSSIGLIKNYMFAIALVITALVATIDEWNQSFNPSRTGTVYDILLDISGGLFAVLVAWLITIYLRRRNA